MIKDDKGDLGQFSYRNRRHHKYHGKPAPHHPSPFHHYQFATVGLLFSYLLAPVAMAMDMMNDRQLDEYSYYPDNNYNNYNYDYNYDHDHDHDYNYYPQ